MKPLGEVCKLHNGRTYKRSELLSEGKYPVLRVGNFFTNQNWYFSDLELDENKYCDDKDLLYAWSASFGPRIWHGGKVIYHYHIWKVEPDPSLVTRDYLYYFFDYDKDLIQKEQGAGATMIHVSKRSMEARNIPLPPLEEQRRIVALLDQAMEGLSRARANTEENLADAKSAFRSLLERSFAPLKVSATHHKLSEVALEFGRGRSRHRPRNDPALYGGSYPFIQTGEIRNSAGLITSYEKTYNETGLAQSKLWPAGTVCITIAANITETGILGFPSCFPDSVIGMIPDERKTTSDYVDFMLRYFSDELKEQGKGSAQDNINLATFERSTFPFPDLAEQLAIVESLQGAHQRILDLSDEFVAKLANLDELQQSLLERAFSGALT